ncbi:hypothetical protein TNIN_413301 [Trichonephila inaurata madagascariensis]|uniref:Uncharacterized protein n=1 Tax=Trichonephila inaurata madagascariensis TaxID=2747483 RepID=A0A8X7BTQ6_9ARAC|nr:hypothetical protein TNIN_413301 [Trichonephila inaurata madagascariensis]
MVKRFFQICQGKPTLPHTGSSLNFSSYNTLHLPTLKDSECRGFCDIIQLARNDQITNQPGLPTPLLAHSPLIGKNSLSTCLTPRTFEANGEAVPPKAGKFSTEDAWPIFPNDQTIHQTDRNPIAKLIRLSRASSALCSLNAPRQRPLTIDEIFLSLAINYITSHYE